MSRKGKKLSAAPRLGSDNPEARDEGPRLIPHDPTRIEVPGSQYYLDLADQALGMKKPAASGRLRSRYTRPQSGS